jgi:molybdopterin-guanine dinucleotide biosynthesis protein A
VAAVTTYAGVVLAGGESRRLGGVDKALLDAGGRTFLDRVLAALSGASERVVVGPPRETVDTVRFVREEPPGGGPAAGLAAALDAVHEPVLVVVAVDLPLLDRATVDRLAEGLTEASGATDGVVLVDAAGVDQPLAGAYRSAALRQALGPSPAGTSLRAVLRRLTVARLPDSAGVCVDAGTWEGVATVRHRLHRAE